MADMWRSLDFFVCRQHSPWRQSARAKSAAGLHILRRGMAHRTAMALSTQDARRNPAWHRCPDALASPYHSPSQTKDEQREGCRREEHAMKSPICDMLGIEFPLLAFSHCRDVVAAVSRAGGLACWARPRIRPNDRAGTEMDRRARRRQALRLDVLIPENISTAGEKDVTWKSLEARDLAGAPRLHPNLLKKYGIELTTTNVADNQPQPFDAQRAMELLEVSFNIRSG
jgi:hypothetical protein